MLNPFTPKQGFDSNKSFKMLKTSKMVAICVCLCVCVLIWQNTISKCDTSYSPFSITSHPLIFYDIIMYYYIYILRMHYVKYKGIPKVICNH